METTPPSEVDGSSNGSIDTLLERLLVGELRIKVDPLTGEIIDSNDEDPAEKETYPPAP